MCHLKVTLRRSQFLMYLCICSVIYSVMIMVYTQDEGDRWHPPSKKNLPWRSILLGRILPVHEVHIVFMV